MQRNNTLCMEEMIDTLTNAVRNYTLVLNTSAITSMFHITYRTHERWYTQVRSLPTSLYSFLDSPEYYVTLFLSKVPVQLQHFLLHSTSYIQVISSDLTRAPLLDPAPPACWNALYRLQSRGKGWRHVSLRLVPDSLPFSWLTGSDTLWRCHIAATVKDIGI